MDGKMATGDVTFAIGLKGSGVWNEPKSAKNINYEIMEPLEYSRSTLTSKI